MEEKQKFLVVCNRKELYDRAMYSVYLKDNSIRPTIKFIYKINSDEFINKFMKDKDENDIELCVSKSLIDFQEKKTDELVRLITFGYRLHDSLSEIKKWIDENVDLLHKVSLDITDTPMYRRIKQALRKINEEPKDEF